MKASLEQKLIKYFCKKSSFSREELFNYFKKTEGEINEGTFGWRIYDLKKKHILKEVKRGHYTLEVKPSYQPEVEEKLSELVTVLEENLVDTKYCIWDLNWLNEFTLHQFNKNYIVFEIEKDLQETLAFVLHDSDHKNVTWPFNSQIPRYASFDESIIIFPLVTRSPVQRVTAKENKSVVFPSLEKILVDIFKDNKLFQFLQGAEMERIFEYALKSYSINFTTLFGYAKRRGKETELKSYLDINFHELVNKIEK